MSDFTKTKAREPYAFFSAIICITHKNRKTGLAIRIDHHIGGIPTHNETYGWSIPAQPTHRYNRIDMERAYIASVLSRITKDTAGDIYIYSDTPINLTMDYINKVYITNAIEEKTPGIQQCLRIAYQAIRHPESTWDTIIPSSALRHWVTQAHTP